LNFKKFIVALVEYELFEDMFSLQLSISLIVVWIIFLTNECIFEVAPFWSWKKVIELTVE
jgi:hypothetical protein